MKRIATLLVILGLVVSQTAKADDNPYGLPDGLYAEITTPRGVVVCELFHQKTPLTVANFVGLAEGTLGPQPRKPFYDGLKWHRVVPGFVVQGGDPTGRGGGGPGYTFPDECVPGLRHDSAGVLQMANSGPDSNGSQYCLMLSPQQRLNFNHTVFGHVVRGLDVLPRIEQGDTMHVKILRFGPDAQAFRADDRAFAEWLAKAKRYTGPREPGPDAPFDDADRILPSEWDRAKVFNFKLANFERFTGRKIVARLFSQIPTEAADGQLDDYLRNEAIRLGVVKAGALAMYFADRDEWHLQIGEDSADTFIHRTYLGEPLNSDRSLAATLEVFQKEARRRGDEFVAQAEKAAAPGRPVAPAQKIKLHVDAMLDGLIFKLEPK